MTYQHKYDKNGKQLCCTHRIRVYKIISAVAILLTATAIKAQLPNKITGLYISAQDFQQNNIAYKVQDNSTKKIIGSTLFNNKNFKVVTNNSKILIPKKNVFGFITSDSLKYRIIDNNNYLLISVNDSLVIYKIITQIPFTGKTNVTPFYFSKYVNKQLIPLTKQNVISQYNLSLQQAAQLNKQFEYNTDLAQQNDCSNNQQLSIFLNSLKQ